MKDLKQKALRGGLVRIFVQGANLGIRLLSVVVLARLLNPDDFGLLAMVTAVTGVFGRFRDFGLSSATIQSPTISHEQLSTLFWLNMFIAVILCGLTLASAPLLVEFYHEPRLQWVTVALAAGFLFNGAAVQHSALIDREMRYGTKAFIEVFNQLFGTVLGIAMAWQGYGYWALVAMATVPTITWMLGVWVVAGWMPGLPRRRVGAAAMVRFGGTVTLNSLISYAAYNVDKLLLGRFWGSEALGIYGRAFQLINIPTDSLSGAIGGVAFSALSRLQNDTERFRSYFLKGYALYLSVTLPITITCGLFAEDVILVMLGPKWDQAAEIFRLLSPTILVFAIMNPFGWVLWARGQVKRSLHQSFVLAPITIGAYVIGLEDGPVGVARAYSIAMGVLVVPFILWCIHGNSISVRDVLKVTGKPLVAGLVAAAAGYGSVVLINDVSQWLQTVPYGATPWGQFLVAQWQIALPRLVVETGILFTVFAITLLFVMGQKSFYWNLWQGLRGKSAE